MLQHTHRVWTSDCIDALSRVDIQRGFLQFFPPEIMGAHVGTAPAHSTGRTQSMAFRAAVALPGHLGVELDARQLSEEQAQELRGWIAIHKALRGRLHQGRVWRGACGDSVVWQAHGDDDAADVLLLAYRLRPSDHRHPPPLCLPMLDTQARYRVREVLPAGTVQATGRHHTAPFFDSIRSEQGLDVHGAWLASAGLPLPRSNAETAFIVQLTKL